MTQKCRIQIRCCALFLLLCAATFSAESRPTSQSDIQKAVERGRVIRDQKKLIPNVLQSSALVMKMGEVRCGQALVMIEDARGEGGAVYKLTERFKAGMADEKQSALIDYSGTFFLAADLALLSGQMRTTSDLINKSDGKQQGLISSATLSVKDDTLSWVRSEQKKDDKEATQKGARKVALHGVRPMPKNALLALAVLVTEAEKDGWKPDPKNALCVPVIDVGWEMDAFEIEPEWVSFDQPSYNNPKDTAAVMRLRSLVGEVTEKGLEIEAPSPPVWQGVQVWALDGRAHALSHPPPEDGRVKIEVADPTKIDVEAPLELEKIGMAASGSPKGVK